MKRVQKKKQKKTRREEELPPVRRNKRETDRLRAHILEGLDQLRDDLER